METKTWICDTCGQEIKKVEDGWVEWIIFPGKEGGRDLRLVHHRPASPAKGAGGKCQFDQDYEYKKDGGIIGDLPLSRFLGPNGLMLLLSFIYEGRLPTSLILEMIKRLHIPGYEHARFYFEEALNEDVFDPNMPPGFYWQDDIRAVLEFANKRRGE